jgi:alpha-galactosidase
MNPRNVSSLPWLSRAALLLASAAWFAPAATNAADTPASNAPSAQAEIRTPKAPATPRINGPAIFGVRPGNPFIYHIPATGDRPMDFAIDGLPSGLKLDAKTGDISGSLSQPGEFTVTLRAKNARGSAEKKFKIVVGETIALTPPMGWNSWNCWGPEVNADKVRQSAHAMASSGLINHGWAYINIDDAWQAPARGGPFHAIQGNEKFPDIKALAAEVHGLGLRIGIYSTPWDTSYAGYIGGSSDDKEGKWSKDMVNENGRKRRHHGQFSFADNDAKQWAAWGIDYLKYDWNPKQSTPTETPELFFTHSETMTKALRASGRDIAFSYSNSMPFEEIAKQAKLYNAWRTTGDIRDNWWSLFSIGFSQSRWAPYSGPGHWNDPDMLVVGYVDVGKGRNLHPTGLTADEQYTHITLWSLLSSPLLIGCDMARLDEFTLNLLTNDEVLAVNQDELGKQATVVSEAGEPITMTRPGRNDSRQVAPLQVWSRELADGSRAVGLFNLGDKPATVTAKWADLNVSGKKTVRDLWRQKDLGQFEGEFSITVAPHGAEMVKVK